jgi:hypothetical protein
LVKVTDTIKSILKKRDAQILSGAEAVDRLLQEVRKQILGELATASGYSALQMKSMLQSIESYFSDFESGANREVAAGISGMWESGASMLPEIGAATGESGVYFGMGHISNDLIDTLKEFSFGRIRSVATDAYTKIKGELTLGLLGQKSPQQIAAEIAGRLDSPSIFKTIAERSEVITQTEMGRAFSIATEKSIESAQQTLPQLMRMWIHGGHPKAPRQVHLLMHGQVRKVGNPFYQTPAGEPVLYPRDPNAPIKEVIRCGCTHVPYMESWGGAQEFAAAFDAKAYEVYKKAA